MLFQLQVCVPSSEEILETVITWPSRHANPTTCIIFSSSFSSRSSEGNSSLLDEGGSASQVPQPTVELAGYGSVVWPDSLSEWLINRAGLQ